MNTNDFDFVAPIYDQLQRLVFGDRLFNSTLFYLDEIEDKDEVLILGGGTGRLLPHVKSNSVCFLDKSKKMVEMARKRRKGMEFIQADFLEWKSSRQFGVIICPFFLDVFSPENLSHVLKKIDEVMLPGGMLLVTDFEKRASIRNRFMLKAMHFFFRITTSMESRDLNPIDEYVVQFFEKVDEEMFGRGVYARLYEKGPRRDP